jgi:hypothetical protein
MFSHLARKVRKYQMPVLVIQLYPEHGVGKRFTDNSFNFYCLFFCHEYSFIDGSPKTAIGNLLEHIGVVLKLKFLNNSI